MPKPTGVLIAEDDVVVRAAMVELIAGEECLELVAVAQDAAEAIRLARERRPEVAVIDALIPRGGGKRATREIRQHAREIHVLVLSVYSEPKTVLEMLQAGASGYLLKGIPADQILEGIQRVARGEGMLSPEVTPEVLTAFARSQPDALTGLPTGALFRSFLKESLARGERDGNDVVLMLLNLDRFEQINERLGYETGDVLLKHVAHRIRGCVDPTDGVARVGGDQFGVAAERVGGRRGARRLAASIIDVVSRPMELGGHTVSSTAGLGIAIAPSDAAGAGELWNKAELALRLAKEAGPGCFRIFGSADDENEAERAKTGNASD